jgi:pyrimidine-nucleoside phosphorylase
MVAACGVPVPMISGRGLGHTGGTLDKLEAIPGFRTDLSVEEYRRAVAEVGAALIGQTRELAPADRKLYALRDVTATVESIPLIGGSIMSKKLAEGIDALVLDVKTGDGAFMRKEEDAVRLAELLVDIGKRFGKETLAFLTPMDEPLGCAVGNWVEVVESVECLRGKNVPDLMELSYVLGGAMVALGGKAACIEEGMKLCRSALWSGRAYEKFLQIVARQGGDIGVIEQPARYPAPAVSIEVRSRSSGYVAGFGARQIGVLSTELGAGRLRMEDPVDPKAGILFRKKIGDRVEAGEVTAVVLTDRADIADEACRKLEALVLVGDEPPVRRPSVLALVDAGGRREWRTPVQY